MQRGEAKAFTAFVDGYGSRVHALSRKYTRCEADAEDLTQEIFVSLYASLPNFRGEAALSTFVYRVAINHCLKHSQRQKPESLAFESVAEPESNAASPEQVVAQRELAETIDQALTKLSPDHRQVVELHELHGLTYAECAAALEIPIGTVKSRLSNAFKRLRVTLAGYVTNDSEEKSNALQQPA
jgi:RNA polymerase sigma-70 factor, ECF subfamily